MNSNETQNIIDIKNLTVHYETEEGIVEAVNNVSFSIKKGEVMGLIGETGAGKTTIALSIMNLLPYPPSHVINGEVLLNGRDVLKMSKSELKKMRGNEVSMIFQDPMTALNPVKYVGEQVAEVIRHHEKCSASEAVIKAMEMLKTVGIHPERYKEYPHQFSGGMKQRIVIAIALACNPQLLIADEPTTALDVTIQAQVIDLMINLQKEKNMSVLMVTHDLGIIADICDRCAVIYGGEIVELGTLEHIFDNPMHPYTIGLFNSLPNIEKDVERLEPIMGQMIDPTDLPEYCSFYDRCTHRCEECKKGDPVLKEVEEGHFVKCFYPQKREV